MNLDSRGMCASALLLITLADVAIIWNIPVLRQVLGLLLLVFLPGFLLIQILGLTEHPLEKTLFLIGLSVSFSMFVPLAMNFFYPLLGIPRPISLYPLIVTFSAILAGLSLVALRTGALDFRIATSDFTRMVELIRSPLALGAGLVLALGILGALFIRFEVNSFFSLISTLSIAIVVIFLVISRRVSPRWYPLYIFVIALALMYSRTLTSPNLFGLDAHTERYFADLIKMTGYWDPSSVFGSDQAVFAMLSVVLLPPVYSTLLSIDLVWVYKLVIPFIFAFVPVCLYQLYKTQLRFSDKLAFLSAVFFMSFWLFIYEVPRQQVAELFLVLVVLLITSSQSRGSRATAVLILFICSVAVSHYSTSYIFLFYLAVLVIGSIITANERQQQMRSVVSATVASLAFFITFGWYLYASGGAPFSDLVNLGSRTVNTFSTELFSKGTDPTVATALGGEISGLAFTHALAHYWVLVTELLIIIGLALTIWRRKALRITSSYLLISIASFFMLLVAIAVPSLGAALSSQRLYAITLLFLAPFCIFAIDALVDAASAWIRGNKDQARKLKYAAFIAVLIPYFLFNYGAIFEITEHPSNYAFLPSQTQSERVLDYSANVSTTWSYLVLNPIPAQDVCATSWLASERGQSIVFLDRWVASEVTDAKMMPGSFYFFTDYIENHSLHNVYIYLAAQNVQDGLVSIDYGLHPISSFHTLTAGDKIYSNGRSEVYYNM